MKIKVSEAIVTCEAINSILELSLPGKVGYRLSRMKSKLDPIRLKFDNARNELIRTYGEPTTTEAGVTRVKVTEANQEKFVAEVNSLLTIEEDVDIFTLNLSDLENLDLPVGFFAALDKFIIE